MATFLHRPYPDGWKDYQEEEREKRGGKGEKRNNKRPVLARKLPEVPSLEVLDVSVYLFLIWY